MKNQLPRRNEDVDATFVMILTTLLKTVQNARRRKQKIVSTTRMMTSQSWRNCAPLWNQWLKRRKRITTKNFWNGKRLRQMSLLREKSQRWSNQNRTLKMRGPTSTSVIWMILMNYATLKVSFVQIVQNSSRIVTQFLRSHTHVMWSCRI